MPGSDKQSIHHNWWERGREERGGELLGGATALFVVELQNEALDVAELLVQVVADLSLLNILRLVLHLSVLRQDALFDVLKQCHNNLRNVTTVLGMSQ